MADAKQEPDYELTRPRYQEDYNKMVFRHAVHVRGQLISTFVFTTKKKMQVWLEQQVPVLAEHYGDITYTTRALPRLKIGDKCCVAGEGMDEFQIKAVVRYSAHRYGFALDSGWTEEIYKCYPLEDTQ